MTMTKTTHVVHVRNTPPPLSESEVASLAGQDARLNDAMRWDHPVGRAHVDFASLQGDVIRMGLTVESPEADVLPPEGANVDIGYTRVEQGKVRLFEIGREPGPPAVMADPPVSPITDEMRRKAREMYRECSYEVPQPKGHHPRSVRCTRGATSEVRDPNNGYWYYRCSMHEGWIAGQVDYGAIRPISLVPHEGEFKQPNARWIVGTAWWRLSEGEADPQNRNGQGRDFYDVLCDVLGTTQAAEMWAEACALDDEHPERRERIGMGPSGPLGEALLAGQTVHADPERGFADGGLITGAQIRTVGEAVPVTGLGETGSASIAEGTIVSGILDPRHGRKPTMTEEECTAHGGHCWERDGIVLTSSPPQYPEHCKHCPATRIGIPHAEPMRYRYPDGRAE